MDENEERKARIKKAVEKFTCRNDPTRTKRKNQKPEKEVELAVCAWLREQGWSFNVFEAKATYNPYQKRYMSQAMAPGISDIGGSTPDGLAVWIELKAPGKRSSLRPKQRTFLLEKISQNNFAVVVDSVDHLSRTFLAFNRLRGESLEKARQFLLDDLPRERVKWDEEDLGF